MNKFLYLLTLILFFVGCAPKPTEENKETEVKNETIPVEEWSKNATIYEVNIRQHTPEGTFNAFEQDIPRIKEMGIKILWLMPWYINTRKIYLI